MRIFICAGEPSGDLHGANLVRALQQQYPGVECVGFGGERMADAGCRLLYPLCQLAIMWFARALAHAPVFLSLLSRADRSFRHHRPDAVVLIDYPGFNWWLARRAHFHRIPVVYFVPPQLWGWGGWRVKKMRNWVDQVLCALPFEKSWYEERGVNAHYVGHPYFDELPQQKLDAQFVTEQQSSPGRIIGLLPGSRTQEVERHLPTLLKTAALVHREQPDVRFMVACFKQTQQEYVNSRLKDHSLPVTTFMGRTPEIIHLSHACVAVSGSVGLELLYRGKPAAVIYCIKPIDMAVTRRLKTSPFISLVNLLARKELFPEFLTVRDESESISRHLLSWMNDPVAYGQICAELAHLRSQVAEPGACTRAASQVLRLANACRLPAQSQAA